jgi:hypothetical protein
MVVLREPALTPTPLGPGILAYASQIGGNTPLAPTAFGLPLAELRVDRKLRLQGAVGFIVQIMR